MTTTRPMPRVRASAVPGMTEDRGTTTSTADQGMTLDVAGRGDVTLRALTDLSETERGDLRALIDSTDRDAEWAARALRLLATWWSFPQPLPSANNRADLTHLPADLVDALTGTLAFAIEGYDAGLLEQHQAKREQAEALRKVDGPRRVRPRRPTPSHEVWLARAYVRGNPATRRCLTRLTQHDPRFALDDLHGWALTTAMRDLDTRRTWAARTKSAKGSAAHPLDARASSEHRTYLFDVLRDLLGGVVADLGTRLDAIEAGRPADNPGPITAPTPSRSPSLAEVAADYERKAATTHDPTLRTGYLNLAADLRRLNDEGNRP